MNKTTPYKLVKWPAVTQGLFLLIGLLINSISINAQETAKKPNQAEANLTLGVTEVALIRVNTQVINMQLVQREAGLSIETTKKDSSARLYISSLISSEPRTLSARISEGVVPDGTVLKLEAMNPNENFVGAWGTLSPTITLDNTDRNFVTNITSCYSGIGTEDGFPLKFTYSLDTNSSTYGQIRASAGNNVIATITLPSLQ